MYFYVRVTVDTTWLTIIQVGSLISPWLVMLN